MAWLFPILLAAPALAAPPADPAAAPCRPKDSSRPSVGLVLSGGGARGAAHVGVLRVLEELQIPIDCIAGTSMGALVGGFYAAGWSPDEIERELLAIHWAELFRGKAPRRNLSFRRKEEDLRYIDFDAGIKHGKLALPHGAAASSVLDFLLQSKTLSVAGIHDFDRLPIPFRAVASDLVTGEEVVLDSGELSAALRASMSIPGVFPPVEAGDRLLVDGGVLNNLPVEVARAMGADVVIAVDVGTPLLRRDQLGSLTGIAFQALSLAAQRRVDTQKLKADVLLEPDLGTIALLDFAAMTEAEKCGERAARGASARLTELVDRQAFATLQARLRRATPPPETLRSLCIAGTPRVDERRLRGRIESRAGEPLDLHRLERDLGSLLEVGEFDRVDLGFTRGEGGVDLAIEPHDNSWGPLYLRAGVNLSDDLQGHNAVNLLVSFTQTGVNALGAEWRNEVQAGRTRRLFSEIYQPLSFGERWFAAASLEYRQELSDVFLEDKKFAEYKVDSLIGGLDLGLQLGEYGELRFGVRRGGAKANPDVGLIDLPKIEVNAGYLRGRLVIDRLDNAAVPREGEILVVELDRAERAFGAELSYDKLSGSYWHFATVRRHTGFITLAGGTKFRGTVPAYDEYLLGGLLSFSGYRDGELRGQYFGLARAGYLFRLAELPQILGTGVYAGGWLEAGNTWQTSDAFGEDLIYTATIATAAETRVGLLYVGYGAADNGRHGFFLSLGQRF
ncbi:MAG TPA: patatin-like phospholipase family protein [Thermoanaerobaculia bacterium]|jgi:NTE family protein|nr:patatin-like phospholipase family protein [Thermoanaerobaculia bacterium]